MILSSRPTDDNIEFTNEDLVLAVTPLINILNWTSAKVTFPDDQHAVREAHVMLEELIDCFGFPDFNVISLPSTSASLSFDVSVRPYHVAKYVNFTITFNVS